MRTRQTIRLGVVLLALTIALPFLQAQQGGIPMFEVDTAWPKVPPQYKLGDPSSLCCCGTAPAASG